jgi:hypothetical protein
MSQSYQDGYFEHIYEILFQNESTNWKSNIGKQLKNFLKLTGPYFTQIEKK